MECKLDSRKKYNIYQCFCLADEAFRFKKALVSQVEAKKFVVVCDGVTRKILPNLKSSVPKANLVPRGPHPCGSYEVMSLKFIAKIALILANQLGLVPKRILGRYDVICNVEQRLFVHSNSSFGT